MKKVRLSGNLIPCALLIVFIVWVLLAAWTHAVRHSVDREFADQD